MHNLPAPGALPGVLPELPNPFLDSPDFPPIADPAFLLSKPTKTRRRRASNAAGQGPTKHKRTRSGCFTCRGRRVKRTDAPRRTSPTAYCSATKEDQNATVGSLSSDLSRQRAVLSAAALTIASALCIPTDIPPPGCAKGHRSCQYPVPPPSKASIAQQRRARRKHPDGSLAEPTQGLPPDPPDSSQQYGVEDQDSSSCQPIHEEDDEDDDSISSSQSPSASAALPGDKSSQAVPRDSSDGGDKYQASPPTIVTGSFSATHSPSIPLPSDVLLAWPHVPQDIRYYLEYYRKNICSLHYSIRDDPDNILDSVLPTIAIRDPALLHAVVSFSAYHSVVQAGDDGKLEDFLQYYNVSVQLLLQSLKDENPTIDKLLTILMLTSLEEYFGDWVNLYGHQKAALAMILQLYTPESIVQTKLGRMILVWYVRFDLIISFRSGDQVALPRDWIASMFLHHQTAAAAHPYNLSHKYAVMAAGIRLIYMNTSILYSRRNCREMTLEQYNQDYDQMTARLLDWRASLDPVLTDPSFLVRELDLRPGNLTGPFVPGELYDTPRFLTSLFILEWHSIMTLHYSRCENMSMPDWFAKAGVHVYGACRLFEAVEAWPSAPKGAVITFNSNIFAAVFFLPPTPENHAWIRQKLALFESLGLIQGRIMREKFSEILKDESCLRWWFPNDRGYTRILQSTRAFADERNAIARVFRPESICHLTEAIAKINVHREEDSAEASKVVVKQEAESSSSSLYPRTKRKER